MRERLSLFAYLICVSVGHSQPVPVEETSDHAATRILAAKKAVKATDVTPLLRNSSFIGDRFVFEIDATGQPEPVTQAIRAAHSVVVWRSTQRPVVKEWLVNLKWDGMIIGPQLIFAGQWRAPIDKMTAEAWLAHQKYNGASENGLIGLARWCRRGGAAQVPALCEAVKAAAVERLVWDRAGQR